MSPIMKDAMVQPRGDKTRGEVIGRSEEDNLAMEMPKFCMYVVGVEKGSYRNDKRSFSTGNDTVVESRKTGRCHEAGVRGRVSSLFAAANALVLGPSPSKVGGDHGERPLFVAKRLPCDAGP
ncbi:hypothetical protein Tco_0058372 [Tanacetum coccineum]